MNSASLLREQQDGDYGAADEWVEVCSLDDIIPGTGVAALVRGEQIAIIRPYTTNEVFAISNYDPFSKAYVMARGIVGDRAGVTKIASPIFKQNFSLSTGECLDDPSVRIPVYPARVRGDRVEVSIYQPEAAE
ncbi:MAG TPA: nitrite reductase small subunit NirD [Polyangiaceae bacterium]|nr:nitrite reductase small subunit NirD [Polyangiaceae bacterium]